MKKPRKLTKEDVGKTFWFDDYKTSYGKLVAVSNMYGLDNVIQFKPIINDGYMVHNGTVNFTLNYFTEKTD